MVHKTSSNESKAQPYRSALSMLVFYMNRAGKSLPAGRKRVLERVNGELKALFGRACVASGAGRLFT